LDPEGGCGVARNDFGREAFAVPLKNPSAREKAGKGFAPGENAERVIFERQGDANEPADRTGANYANPHSALDSSSETSIVGR
jgi:hypothetical protein